MPKFKIVFLKVKFCIYTKSNMKNSMVMTTFSFFHSKYPFWAKLVIKIKIVSLNKNLVLSLIWICKFSGNVHFFHFPLAIPFLDKFGPKHQNCHFNLKSVTETKSNVRNSEFNGDIHFFRFQPEIPFLGMLDSKNQNCHFKWKFGILVSRLIRICRILW